MTGRRRILVVAAAIYCIFLSSIHLPSLFSTFMNTYACMTHVLSSESDISLSHRYFQMNLRENFLTNKAGLLWEVVFKYSSIGYIIIICPGYSTSQLLYWIDI